MVLLAVASALPLVQGPAGWRELGALAIPALALAAVAIAARSSRPLFWVAILLCCEELVGLEIARRPAGAWTFAFAVLLFAGLESAYAASASTHNRQPLVVYAKSLLPLYAAAVGATVLIALLPRSSAIYGLRFILVGLGGATALIVVLALLVLHVHGQAQR